MEFSRSYRRDSIGGYDEERFENEIDSKLLCPICLKVLKDPVQCPKEHYFCRSCIKKHLHENTKTCPMCKHHLTETTLTKAPRFLIETLLGLKIRCNYANRGCRELIKLEFLDHHVQNCGYSPTCCTNLGCEQEINQRDKERHESELCRFRLLVCDECGLEVLQKAFLGKEGTERCDLFTGRVKIFVCGGRDGNTTLNSVESYSWPENVWKLEPAMKLARSIHSAFVYERRIYVTGGWTGTENTDSIESLDVDKEHIEWIELPVKMPTKCRGHKMIYHENSVILTGGGDFENFSSNGILEIQLDPPYATELLTRMPEPRWHHGCEIIDNQVVIAGGLTSEYTEDTTKTVCVYDINNDECKLMAPLPFPISDMATVSYKDNVILIGGVNEKDQTLNTVIKYNIKTGNIEMLPCLNHKRALSAAVIVGNVILVMGGLVFETKTRLDSVECLDLKSNVWRELPPMRTKRGGLTAVVKPVV